MNLNRIKKIKNVIWRMGKVWKLKVKKKNGQIVDKTQLK